MTEASQRLGAAPLGQAPAPKRRNQAVAAHVFTLLFIAAWQFASWKLPQVLMPGPLEVLRGLVEFLSSARGLKHLGTSLYHVLVAIVVSFTIGSLLALLPRYVPISGFAIHRRLGPFLNAFSGIGWTLLAVMWFGINSASVVFAIGAVLVPFALVNLSTGLENLDNELVEMSTSFTRGRWRTFRLVVLPLLAPFVFATVRIMFGVAWKVTLTAELFGGNSGLGYVINLARQDYDTTTIFVCIVLIVAFVYGMDRFVFAPVQARLSRWK